MTPKEHAVERMRLAGAVHAASDGVYRITGRTDQSLNEIIALYPENEAVKSLLDARKAVVDFERGPPKEDWKDAPEPSTGEDGHA